MIERKESTTQGALESLFYHCSYWPAQSSAFCEFVKALQEPELTIEQAVKKIERWSLSEIHYQTDLRQSDNPGIRLMTVHGSKGLEFPHVYLTDCLRQPPRVPPPVLWDENGNALIRYRQDGEWVSSEAYESAKEREKLADAEEAKRILYVALTRAESTLSLLLPEEDHKVPSGSWAQLLAEN